MWPLNKILFPVDFSERSKSAARHVRTLGCRLRAEITLMHVLTPLTYAIAPMEASGQILQEAWEAQERGARSNLEEFATRELAAFRVKLVLAEGDPAGAIVEHAHTDHSDLIVMPTRGYGQFRRFILGSVTAKVLHDAECPVWTGAHLEHAPQDVVQAPAIGQVVCAVDLFGHSAKVVDWAAHLANAFNARLFLVHAVPQVAAAKGDYYRRDWRDVRTGQAREELEKLLRAAGAAGETLVVAGEPPAAVCGQAQELRADVLVIGRSSESGLMGRLRTNAYAIIRGAHCPVVSV